MNCLLSCVAYRGVNGGSVTAVKSKENIISNMQRYTREAAVDDVQATLKEVGQLRAKTALVHVKRVLENTKRLNEQ